MYYNFIFFYWNKFNYFPFSQPVILHQCNMLNIENILLLLFKQTYMPSRLFSASSNLVGRYCLTLQMHHTTFHDSNMLLLPVAMAAYTLYHRTQYHFRPIYLLWICGIARIPIIRYKLLPYLHTHTRILRDLIGVLWHMEK